MNHHTTSLLLLALLGLLPRLPAHAQQPPSPPPIAHFRANGTGQSPDANPLLQWHGPRKTNILWSTRVGNAPNSSPFAIAGRVLVISPPADLICLDGNTGAKLWQKSNTSADLDPNLPDRPARGNAGNTSPSPVSDGRFVYAVFGNGIVACYDLAGRRQWASLFDLPPPQHGRSASPTVLGDKLILSIGHLFAVDAPSGKPLWKAPQVPEKYGTPVPMRLASTDLIIAPTGHVVRASDGAVLAKCPAQTEYTSPLVAGDTVFFLDATTAAFRFAPNPPGQVQPTQLWQQDLEGEFFSSPVCADGLLHAVSNDGNYYVIDAHTGNIRLKHELDIPSASGKPGFPNANLYPSLCLANSSLFLGNDAGDMLVLQPGPHYKQLHQNRLAAGSGATPAFTPARLYLRAGDTLHCIGR